MILAPHIADSAGRRQQGIPARTMIYRALMLALAGTAHGWNQCEGPQVDWMALDEGVGKSASYAVAAMNGNMYSAGYTKGNFAFVGVTNGADVNPVPSATLWGDTNSDAQVRDITWPYDPHIIPHLIPHLPR